jgi:predicted nucleic acid-binding protein
MHTLIIDSNILISALIKKGITRDILTNLNINFIFPEYGLEEVYFYKREIVKKAKISEGEFDLLLLRLLKYVRLVPIEVFINFREEADKIMRDIDRQDVVFISTALAFHCPVWSDDKHFQKQKEVVIYTTKDMIKFYKNDNSI